MKYSKILPLQSKRVGYLDGQDMYMKKIINNASKPMLSAKLVVATINTL